MNTQTKDTTKNNRRVHEGEMFVVGEFYASSEAFQVIIIMSMKGQRTKRSCQVKQCQLSSASQATKQKSRIFCSFLSSVSICSLFLISQAYTQPASITQKRGCIFCGREATTAKSEYSKSGMIDAINEGIQGEKSFAEQRQGKRAVYSHTHCILIIFF